MSDEDNHNKLRLLSIRTLLEEMGKTHGFSAEAMMAQDQLIITMKSGQTPENEAEILTMLGRRGVRDYEINYSKGYGFSFAIDTIDLKDARQVVTETALARKIEAVTSGTRSRGYTRKAALFFDTKSAMFREFYPRIREALKDTPLEDVFPKQPEPEAAGSNGLARITLDLAEIGEKEGNYLLHCLEDAHKKAGDILGIHPLTPAVHHGDEKAAERIRGFLQDIGCNAFAVRHEGAGSFKVTLGRPASFRQMGRYMNVMTCALNEVRDWQDSHVKYRAHAYIHHPTQGKNIPEEERKNLYDASKNAPQTIEVIRVQIDRMNRDFLQIPMTPEKISQLTTALEQGHWEYLRVAPERPVKPQTPGSYFGV